MLLFSAALLLLFFVGLKTSVNTVFSKEIVTVLKPFLAIGVVLHHLNAESVFLNQFERWGAAIVSVFFFISGYGLAWSFENVSGYCKNFLVRKIFLKLLIPYLTVIITYIFLFRGWRDYNLMSRLVSEAVPTFVPNDWFILALIYCYLIFKIGTQFKTTRGLLLTLFVGTLLLAIFTNYWGYARNWYATPMAFFVGSLYQSVIEPRIKNRLSNRRNYVFYELFLFVLFGSLVGLNMIFKSDAFVILSYSLLPLLVINSTLRLNVSKLSKNKVIVLLGDISLEIYLVHGMVVELLHNNLPSLHGEFLAGVTLGVTILLSYVLNSCSNSIQGLIQQSWNRLDKKRIGL